MKQVLLIQVDIRMAQRITAPGWPSGTNPYPKERDEITKIMQREPERITYELNVYNRPYYRRIFIDGENMHYVHCTQCTGGVIFKYYQKKGSGQILCHEKGLRHIHGKGLNAVEAPNVEAAPPKKKKPGRKPQGSRYPPIWDHCKDTGRKTDLGAAIRSCNYCGDDVGAAQNKAIGHMKNECLSIPDEIKKKFQIPRKRFYIDASTTEDSDQDDYIEDDGDSDQEDDQNKVVKILTGLLKQGSNNDRSEKKPLSEYTDSDFDREMKELAIKKARLEVENLEDQMKERKERTKLYHEIRSGLKSFVESVSLLATTFSQSSSGVMVPHSSSILQEAYEDSVAGNSVTGISVNGLK